jgi:hypothetical protein
MAMSFVRSINQNSSCSPGSAHPASLVHNRCTVCCLCMHRVVGIERLSLSPAGNFWPVGELLGAESSASSLGGIGFIGLNHTAGT